MLWLLNEAMMKQNAIADILMQNWDPIGISDEPLARDEYQPYVAMVLALLNASASVEMIASKLLDIERTQMGLAGDVNRAQKVAALLKAQASAPY
jgi:hypothetical protein